MSLSFLDIQDPLQTFPSQKMGECWKALKPPWKSFLFPFSQAGEARET